MLQVLGKCAQHRPASDEEDVAQWGSRLIYCLLTVSDDAIHKARWLDAGAEKVLRDILKDSGASSGAKSYAGYALRNGLGLTSISTFGLKQN